MPWVSLSNRLQKVEMTYLWTVLFVAVGWFVGRRYEKLTYRITQLLLLLLTAMLVVQVISGFSRFDNPNSIHRELSHWVIIGTFVAGLMTIGVNFARLKQMGLIRLVSSIVAILALLMMIGTESMIGYLGPTYRTAAAEETVNIESANRFMVLHLYFFPTLIALFLVVNFWLTRERHIKEVLLGKEEL